MTKDQIARAKALVTGALTADAAAMGLHWIYDQDHIAKVAPEVPEFRSPDAANYQGVPAFYAHPTRVAGDLSQYGEQLLVMLRALLATGGTYDAATYAATFQAHFGYGGGYVGYIDHATRDTLDNIRRAEDAALAQAQTIPFDGAPDITRKMVTKALALRPKFSGDALRAEFEQAVRMTHDTDAIVAHGFDVLDMILRTPAATGAHDEQLPAIAKLPPLVARMASADDAAFEAAVASAIKTTSDHPNAAALGMLSARMMQAAVLTGDLDAVTAAARTHGTDQTKALIEDAIARETEDNAAATRHFGMACDLTYGVPSALHNMRRASGYTDAVRTNIYAGGDTCGRAILVGGVMGALNGDDIPPDWIAKLTHRDTLSAGLKDLLG